MRVSRPRKEMPAKHAKRRENANSSPRRGERWAKLKDALEPKICPDIA